MGGREGLSGPRRVIVIEGGRGENRRRRKEEVAAGVGSYREACS